MRKFSLKSKIVTGVVVASVIGSSTFAFANTNAGTQFTTWGQAQIEAAKTAVKTDLAGKLATQQTAINTKAANDKAAAEGRINQAGTDEKADTKSKIEAKLADHVASLRTALQTFLDAIGGDFDSLVSTSNSNTTSTLNHQYNQLNADITTVLNAAKAANVKSVTEESLLVKGKATSDLIKEINRVKSELATRVNSEKETATTEVTNHLTSEVARINDLLDTLISGLETSAKDAIAAAGLAVETSAIANFERVIGLTQTETPIKVDEQKLKWVKGNMADKKIKFTVTNSNEFDVVYRYKFITDGPGSEGVSETPYAESSAAPGVSSLTFDVEQLRVLFVGKVDKGGLLVIEYMDENGDFKYGAEFKLVDADLGL
jgi:hypothetical protein